MVATQKTGQRALLSGNNFALLPSLTRRGGGGCKRALFANRGKHHVLKKGEIYLTWSCRLRSGAGPQIVSL